MSKQPSSITWVFFPVKGLEIETEPDTIHSRLFERATLLSFDDARTFTSSMPFAVDQEEANNVLHMLGAASSYGEDMKADSFIAVQTYGYGDKEIQAANDRAYEVISVLSIAFLFRSNFRETCYLLEQLTQSESITIPRVNTMRGDVGHTYGLLSRAHFIGTPSPPIKRSRSGLLATLKSVPTIDLCSALLLPKSSITGSHRGRISRAARFLYEGMHVPTPESQVLGAITSIEILLSGGRSSFEVIRTRLKELLGKRAYTYYRADEVFDARNEMVHSGKRCTDTQGYLALVLAVSALLAYAKVAYQSPRDTQLLKQLDFTSAAEKFMEEFKGAIIQWDKPPLKNTLPDLFPFHLAKWGYSYDYVIKFTPRKRQEQFAALVSVLAFKRSISNREAFYVLSNALLNVECPFSTWHKLASYIRRHPETVTAERDRMLHLLKKYSWGLD